MTPVVARLLRVAVALLLLALVATTGSATEISVGPDATILRDGQPYRGIGVNYFDCFIRVLKNREDTSYEAGFRALAAREIPFVRFSATAYWPSEMKLYQENREEYFHRFDRIVRAAEANGIGLIPSLFWYAPTVPDLVGEPLQAWGDPASATQRWMRDYVKEVVGRYKDSPAIWAWEFGNEYALGANLPNSADHRPPVYPDLGTAKQRTAQDDITVDILGAAYAAFASEVRKYDSRRLITSGDSRPRASLWNQWKHGTWTHDTDEQALEVMRAINPDPCSLMSIHVYEHDDDRLGTMIDISRKLKKPLFVGEFGAPGGGADVEREFDRILAAIVSQGIPLSALWVFDFPDQKEFSVTAENTRSRQLTQIVEANRKFRDQTAASKSAGPP